MDREVLEAGRKRDKKSEKRTVVGWRNEAVKRKIRWRRDRKKTKVIRRKKKIKKFNSFKAPFCLVWRKFGILAYFEWIKFLV